MAINPDKIQVMDEPFYTPSVDIYDRDSAGPVIQLGVTLKHFTGDLYMKLSHFHYIATQKLGFLAPADAKGLYQQVADLSAENEELKEELKRKEEETQDGFNERLDVLIANYINSGSAIGINPPVASNSNSNSTNKNSKSAKADSGEDSINL